MKKSFSTQEETLDKTKEFALSLEAAAKCVQNTPSRRYTLRVKGELIKPSHYKQPNADSLVQLAQTEKGKTEISCVIDQNNHDS